MGLFHACPVIGHTVTHNTYMEHESPYLYLHMAKFKKVCSMPIYARGVLKDVGHQLQSCMGKIVRREEEEQSVPCPRAYFSDTPQVKINPTHGKTV